MRWILVGVVFLMFYISFNVSFVLAQPALVAYYKFDDIGMDILKDHSGNENHGTINGATLVDGKFQNCLRFDGVNDYVEIVNSGSLNITDNITIEAWVYPFVQSSGVIYKGIVTKGGMWDYDSSYQLYYGNDENFVGEIRWGSGTYNRTQVSYLMPTNQWVHVAMTRDGSCLKLYINGELENAVVSEFPPQTNSRDVWIGGSVTDGSGRYFNGAIDELRIYNGVLNKTEIKNDAQITTYVNVSIGEDKILKNLLYFKMAAGNWFVNLNENVISSLENSPYTGFIIPVISAYNTSAIPKSGDYLEAFQAAKQSDKNIWTVVFLNRIVGCPDAIDISEGCTASGGRTTCWEEGPYFSKIRLMDMYGDSEVHAKDDFFQILNFSLDFSKETGSRGIVLDFEAYNNYCANSIEKLANKFGKSTTEIEQQLRQIGYEIADLTNEIYPEAVLLLLFYQPTEINNNSVNFITEGILERAKDNNYILKVVEGGETSMGYVHTTFKNLRDKLETRRLDFENYLQQYPNLRLGATLAPYEDIKKTIGWVKNWYDFNKCKIEVKIIDDFLHLFELLFNSNEYVWFYADDGTKYDEYNETVANKFHDVIEEALTNVAICGNSICELGEALESCANDCFIIGDLNNDGNVDIYDLTIITANLGKTETHQYWNATADVVADGEIDVFDLVFVASRFT